MLHGYLFSFSHFLPFFFTLVVEAAEVEPAVDEVEGEFLGEIATVFLAVVLGKFGGDADFTGGFVVRAALKGDDVSRFRVLVVSDVELGVFFCAEKGDGEFAGDLELEGEFRQVVKKVLDIGF